MKMSEDEESFDFVTNPDDDADPGDEEVEIMDDLQIGEFEELNARLDQLNQILDNLEKKNDSILTELVELLESSRQTRQQFQKLNEETSQEQQ